jgi:hypothetical protein
MAGVLWEHLGDLTQRIQVPEFLAEGPKPLVDRPMVPAPNAAIALLRSCTIWLMPFVRYNSQGKSQGSCQVDCRSQA